MLENEMMIDGVSYLYKLNQYKKIKQEVPFLSRCIDVILINDMDEIISIEFKISKWRHAIEQAKNHKLGADKSYICLPERKKTDVLLQAVKEAGLGLLFFNPEKDERIYEVVEAPNNHTNPTVFRQMLLMNLQRI